MLVDYCTSCASISAGRNCCPDERTIVIAEQRAKELRREFLRDNQVAVCKRCEALLLCGGEWAMGQACNGDGVRK